VIFFSCIMVSGHEHILSFLSITRLDKLIYFVYKYSVRTSQRTPCFSISTANQRMLYMRQMAVHRTNRTKLVITSCGQDATGSFSPPVARQPLGGLGRLVIDASRSHSDTPHSVGFLWTSDQPVAETST
jgi:hypothetical protein